MRNLPLHILSSAFAITSLLLVSFAAEVQAQQKSRVTSVVGPGCDEKSLVPNQAFADSQDSYATNEIAINWNAPFAYLANAIEALRSQVGYIK